MKTFFIYILSVFTFLLFSCTEEEDFTNLGNYINSTDTVLSSVIACSASEYDGISNSTIINTFFYPREGATSFKLYESSSTNIDKMNFELYELVEENSEQVFGGKLNKFVSNRETENYFIVTFEENDSTHISDPILTSFITNPTKWDKEVMIDQSNSLEPQFNWEEVPKAVIYFQLLSDNNNEVLSGTYTYDTNFTYYDKTNVILDINTVDPPQLVVNKTYNFTLMCVSDENWVVEVAEEMFVSE